MKCPRLLKLFGLAPAASWHRSTPSISCGAKRRQLMLLLGRSLLGFGRFTRVVTARFISCDLGQLFLTTPVDDVGQGEHLALE